MPIRKELQGLYPSNWTAISYYVRFMREQGVCQGCGRRHDEIVHRLQDGRWFDATQNCWRDGAGKPCPAPDLFEFGAARTTRVILAAAHLDNNPAHNEDSNWAAYCQRCHLLHDAPYHRRQRRITYMRRHAIADLFLGDYEQLPLKLALGKVSY